MNLEAGTLERFWHFSTMPKAIFFIFTFSSMDFIITVL